MTDDLYETALKGFSLNFVPPIMVSKRNELTVEYDLKTFRKA